MTSTCYEIILRHEDGRRYLVCYANNSPSRSRLIRAIRARWQNIERKLGLTEMSWQIDKKASLGIQMNGWHIHYSGRTERESKSLGQTELEYCA